MNEPLRLPTGRPGRTLLLVVALAASLSLLTLLPDSPTLRPNQSPSAAIDAPVLTAQARRQRHRAQLDRNCRRRPLRTMGLDRRRRLVPTRPRQPHRLPPSSTPRSAPGTEYYYAVRAIAAGGTASAWSNYPSATAPTSQTTSSTSTPTATPTPAATPTPTQAPPASALTPPSLTAAAGQNAIELSWTPNSAAVRYDLWAWTEADGWYQLDDGNLTDTSFQHSQVTLGTEYYFAVRTVYASGPPSSWSEYASQTWGAATANAHRDSNPNANIYTHRHAHAHTNRRRPPTEERSSPSIMQPAAPTGGAAETGSPTSRSQPGKASPWTNTGRVGELRLSNKQPQRKDPGPRAPSPASKCSTSAQTQLTGPIPDLSALTRLSRHWTSPPTR